MKRSHEGIPFPLRLLQRVAPADDQEHVVSYMIEVFERERRRRGRAGATLWVWPQVAILTVRLVGERFLEILGGGHSQWRRWVEWARGDVRYAIRGLGRAPGFTLAAVLTLGLGFGATAAVFSVFEAAVLRPLPVYQPERLVRLWPGATRPLSLRQFHEFEQITGPFMEPTAFTGRRFALLFSGAARELDGLAVSPNHFEVLGVPPLLGRGFRPSDAVPGAEPVAVVSHDLWVTQFGADSSIVGRSVSLFSAAAIPMLQGAFSGASPIVVGIAPPGYDPFDSSPQVWVPLVSEPVADVAYVAGVRRGASYADLQELAVVGRLRDGVSADRAASELGALLGGLSSFAGEEGLEESVPVLDLHRALRGSTRQPLTLSLGAAALVLLIACVNVANLLLARGLKREREFAVRRALGATRARIVAQSLTESGLIAVLGAAAGVGVFWLVIPTAVAMLPPHLLAHGSVVVSGRLLAVIGLGAALCAGLMGVLPGLRASSGTVRGTRAIGSRRGTEVHRALLVTELAMGVTLAAAAGLLTKSLLLLNDTDIGFNAANVVTVRVAPADAKYIDVERRRTLIRDLLQEIRAEPDIAEAGAIHFLPMAESGTFIFFRVRPDAEAAQRLVSSYRVITPGYLSTMQIPVLAGRDFASSDGVGSPPVGLVNAQAARALWPGEPAVGKTLYRTSGDVWFTVVGVVGDVRQFDREQPAEMQIYLPLEQSNWANAMSFVARVRAETALDAGNRIREIVNRYDPDVPVTRVATMDEVLINSVAVRRFYARLFAGFAGLATVLAAVGAFGVTSFVVGQRTKSIGVRLTLGATMPRLVVGELVHGVVPVVVGVLVGAGGAVALGRLLAGMLFEVTPWDAPVLALVVAGLGVVGALAVLGPVWRAVRVDPMSTLRSD